MNSFIEQLNRWGEAAIPVAAQVLWQTSLLIIVLLALDLLLRNRIRAGFRYALWMLLLVKLVLPPSFALPTGAGYWIDRTAKVQPLPQPPAARQPVEVIYSDATLEPIDFDLLQSVDPSPSPIVPIAPPTRLTRDGSLLVAWAGGTLLLFAWMLWRWWWVIRLVRASSPAPAELRTLLVGVHALACSGRVIGAQANTADKLKLGLQPGLRLTDTAMSPAVCGLFRPVILLPRKLVDKLTTEQLRTVLLHELIHLRRRDLWVNCAQTLLQIAAWWHPLLWVANARIRRVREEAVDEAVACALRDDADAYPATLLEVAKLTFTRPLLTLGLVGILESKSALKQRIHRLLELPPMESTRLKWWQWVAVAALALTALPMAQGQPSIREVIEAPTAPTLTSRSGISYDQKTDLSQWENPKPRDTVIGYEYPQPTTRSHPTEASGSSQARLYAQAERGRPRTVAATVWALKLDRRTWEWLIRHPGIRRVDGQTNTYVLDGASLGDWLDTQAGVEKLKGGQFSVPEHRSIVVGDFSPDRRTIEPYSQARIELTPWFNQADPRQVWLKLDSIIDWSGEMSKSRNTFMPAPGGNSSGAPVLVNAFERARGYVNQQFKTDGTVVGLGDWLIIGEPFNRQTIEPIFAVVAQPLLAPSTSIDRKPTLLQPADDRSAPSSREATNPSVGISWGVLFEQAPDWPGWGLRRPSLPHVLDSTNFVELGRIMITDRARLPDPRFTGYHAIGLEPRFVLVPLEGLAKALDGPLPLLKPLVVASNRLSALTNDLIVAGAADHTTAEPVLFAKISGGVIHWRVARDEPSLVQFQTQENAAKQSIVFGARAGVPAHVPDWVPLTLLARPFVSADESLHCLLSFSTGEYQAELLAMAEETIPLGAALVWASTNGVRAGFAQVVFLKNTGSAKTEETAADQTAAPETNQRDLAREAQFMQLRQKLAVALANEFDGQLGNAARLYQEAYISAKTLSPGTETETGRAIEGTVRIRTRLATAFRLSRNYADADEQISAGLRVAPERAILLALKAANDRDLVSAEGAASERKSVRSAGEDRGKLIAKLNQIILPEVKFERVPLKDVVQQLTGEAHRLGPSGEGINFMIASANPNPAEGAKPPTADNKAPVDLGETIIDINPPMANVKLIDVLRAITMAADQRIKFTVEEFAVVFSPKPPETEQLETRVFRVNANIFSQGLQRILTNLPARSTPSTNAVTELAPGKAPITPGGGIRGPTTTNDMSALNIAARDYFEAAGVELIAPKMLYFNNRTGRLMVKATLDDLEIIQRAIEMIDYPPPQILLEVRAVEVTYDDVRALGFDWFVGDTVINGDTARTTKVVTGILTDPQFRIARQAMSQRLRVEISTQHRLVTLSGGQTQVVLTNRFVNGPLQMNLTRPEAMNPVLDLIPYVSPDGFTIRMTVIPTFVELVSTNEPGALMDSPNQTPNSGTGEKSLATNSRLPRYRLRQEASSVNVWDGQTIVQSYPLHVAVPPPYLAGAPPASPDETGKRHLLIFITPTIVDAAGNAVHKPGDLPLANELVPPQRPTEP